jgi:hypothetical protein
MVTCRSAMASSNADCTFAGARLISSARTRLANTGPLRVVKPPDCGIVNLRADDVGGQHVRRELQAREFDAEGLRERFHGERLGEAGHAFEEDVAVGEQADDEAFGEIILADDDLAEFVEERPRERAGFLDRFVDGVDSCVHESFPMLRDGWTGKPSESVQTKGL